MPSKVQTDSQQSATPSMEATVRPDLNGLIVAQPGSNARYLVDWGYKRLLSNTNIFRPNPTITPWDVSEISTGNPVFPGAMLIQATGTGVYLLDTNPLPDSGPALVKRPIISQEIFQQYQFGTVTPIPLPVLQAIPTGLNVEPRVVSG